MCHIKWHVLDGLSRRCVLDKLVVECRSMKGRRKQRRRQDHVKKETRLGPRVLTD